MQAEAKIILANLVEDQLTALLQDAKCVQRHTKRVRLHHTSSSLAPTPNITSSSSSLPTHKNNTNNNTPIIRPSLDADDINLALQWRGSEIIYPTNAGKTLDSSSDSDDPSHRDRSQQNIDLNAYVRSAMPSHPPSEIGCRVHWLSVDGIQPSIPQNPVLGRDNGTNALHRVEDDDDDGPSPDDDDDDDDATGDVNVRQLLPRLLSEELQLYFTRITLAVEKGFATQQDAALSSVARDAGTQELVPFFSRFVANRIHGNVGRAEYCRTLIRLADALISNPHMHLELHLHQILPAIITCVVATRLSSQPDEDHWALREESARTLVKACTIFGNQYTTLKSRVLKTLCEAIGPNKPLTTQYGGIVGISLFGPKAIDAFLLPLAPIYWAKWEKELETQGNWERRFDLYQCQTAMLNAIGTFMHYSNFYEKYKEMDIGIFDEIFGEKLIPFQTDQLGYETYVI